MVGESRNAAGSGNPGLALKPADILNNLIDVTGGHGLDLRHVPELPVVCLHSVGRSPLERRIAVVVRFVNLVHERRTLLRAHPLLTMTNRTVRVEFGFARLQLDWNRPSADSRLRLRRVTGHEGGERRRDYQDMQARLR